MMLSRRQIIGYNACSFYTASAVFLMSDKREFLRHTLIFGVGNLLGQTVPLILFPLYTNYLTSSEYGTLDVIQRTSDIINTVFLIGGIRLAAMTFYKQAENEEARKRIAVTISVLLWLTVAAAIAVSIGFADYIEIVMKTGDTRLLSFGLAITLLEALLAVPLTLTQARLESLRFVLTNISILTTKLCLCIYFVAILRWNIWGVLAAQGIVSSVFAVLLTLRELRIGSIYPDVSKWKEILRFAVPLIPGGIFAFFYGMADRFFVINFGPYETGAAALGAIGTYAIADRLVYFTRFAGVSPMQLVWNSKMYEVYANRPDAGAVFGNFFLRIFCLQAFFGFLVSLFAEEIVNIVCGSSYRGAAVLIPLCAVAYCQSLFIYYAMNTFYIMRRTHYNLYCNSVALLCMLFFLRLFVPVWGVLGAAVSALLSRCMYGLAAYLISQRCFVIRYPFKKILLLLLMTVSCYGVGVCCGSGFDTSAAFSGLSKWERLSSIWERIRWLPVFGKLGVVSLWIVAVWFSGILSPEDKQILFKALNKLRQRLRGR